MPATFNVRFIINEKTQTRVLRLTDTSTGFTFSKGNISITFPDGSTRIKTDFNSPDISVAGGFVDVACVLDARNNVITGEYKIDYVALDTSNVEYTATRQFDFNFVKPTNGIVNEVDVVIPEVKFSDSNSYSTNGSFTGSIIKTLSASFPVTSAASGLPAVTTTGNIIDVKNVTTVANYYEGVYNPTSDINALYTHSSNAWLTIKYDELFTKQIIVKKCPDQYTLIQKINNYRAVIDGYKELNDDRFNLLSEQYDLVIALYSHVIARYDAGLQDGSEPQLRELLSILEPYDTNYTYQSGPIGPFELTPVVGNSFNISNGSSSDSFQLGQTLSFVSGSAALQIALGNNILTWTPVFGSTAATFAQGNDARFHDQVTIGTGNGLSIANQVLSLALVTNVTAGAMSAADKVLFDAIPTTYVKYNGSIANVNLGEYGLKAGWLGFDLTPTGTPTDVGTMSWNDQDGTVDLKLKGGNVTLQVGQEQVSRIVNKTGINLLESNYQVVRVDGAQGNRLKVALAQANNDANSAETLGIVTETIPDNEEGFITTSGLVRNIDTTGTLQGETWADGDMLYLSGTTAGRLTKIKPQAPTHTVIMGYVVRAHQTQGAIYVKVDNGYEIDELHNISITAPANNQALVYESATSLWKNKALFGAGGLFTTTDILEGTNLYYTQARFDSAFAAKSTTNLSEGTNLYYTQARFDSAFSAKSTTNLSEGTNLYFTNTRARQAISETITGIDYDNTTGVFSITSGYGIPTTAKQGEWDSAYNDVILTASVSGTSTKTLTLTQRDGGTITASWSDIDTNLVTSVFGRTGAVTAQSGDYTTAQVTESGNLYFTELRVRDTVLTGLNVTGGTVIATDSVLAAFGKIQNQLNTLSGSTQYQGVWNASTNSPTITSSSGTKGHYYKVSVAGTTSIDGINDWEVGDWIIFNGTTWDKVDNTDKVSSVNGFTGAVSLTTSNITEGTNLYYTDTRSRAALSFAAGSGAYNSTTGVITIPTNTNQLTNGASFITLASLSGGTGITYNNTTGVIAYSGTVYTDSSIRALFSAGAGISYNNTTGVITSTITQYTDAMARASLSFVAGSGAYNSTTGVITIPTNTNQLTNGASFITLASLSASAPLSYNNGTGAFSISQASGSTNGFLSSTDWNTFNNKQNALTNPVTGTGTTNYLPKFTGSTSIGNSLVYDNGTNVGIGTTSLYTKFTIQTTNNRFEFDQIDSTTSYLEILDGTRSTSNILSIYAKSLNFYTRPSSYSLAMTITSAGNVGIGTTSPSARLEVNGGSSDGSLFVSTTGNYSYLSVQKTNAVSTLGRWNVMYRGDTYFGNTTNALIFLGERFNASSVVDGYYMPLALQPNGNVIMVAGSNVIGNGNVGIGTTSPNQKLTISDSGYPIIGFNIGTTAQGYIGSLNGGGIALNSQIAQPLMFYTNDIERMRINAGGNVSIGNTNNTYKLDVSGTGRFTGALNIANDVWHTTADGTQRLFFSANSNTYLKGTGVIIRDNNDLNMLTFVTGGQATFSSSVTATTFSATDATGSAILTTNGGGEGVLSVNTANPLRFFTNGSERMRITSGGLVGIGTSSPSGILHLASSGTPRLFLQDTDAGAGNVGITFRESTSDKWTLASVGGAFQFFNEATSSNAIWVTATNNVGIGTTSPSYKLDVAGSLRLRDNTPVARLEYVSGAFQSQVEMANNYDSFALAFYGNTTLDNYILYHSESSGYTMFQTAGSERMRITNAGRVGIGTSSPSNLLHLYGTDGNSYLRWTSDVATTGARIGYNGTEFRIDQQQNADITFRTNGSERMRITSGGNLGLGVTPSAWLSGYPVIQMPQLSIFSGAGGGGFIFGNAFLNTSGSFIYQNSGLGASAYNNQGGGHQWSVAPSGTAGNAISFTQAMTLDASGRLLIGSTNSTNGLLVINSTSATGVRFALESSGTMNGIVAIGNNAISGLSTTDMALWTRGVMAFETGASGEKMRITSGGNVGIGTTSPQDFGGSFKTLDVQGSTGGYVLATNSGASTIAQMGVGSNIAYYGLRTSGDVAFTTGNTERMRITSAGNVGIGTTSPSLKLEVVASNPSSGILAKILNSATSSWTGAQIQFTQDSLADWVIGQPAGVNAFAFWVNRYPGNAGSEVMRITSGGNVGIGTTSPSTALHVIGAGTFSSSVTAGGFISTDSSTVSSPIDTTSTKAYISAASINGAALTLVSDSVGRTLRLSSNTSGTSIAAIDANSTGFVMGTNTNHPIVFTPNATERMRLTSAGELLIGTTTDNGAYLLQVNSQIWATNATIATSDARLKTDISSLGNSLDLVMKMSARTFKYRQDTEYNFTETGITTGFIAQELKEVLAGTPYADSIVVEAGKYYGVAYEKIIPLLVKSIQEQQAQIEELKSKINK